MSKKQAPQRTSPELGAYVRRVIKQRGKTQEQVAAAAKIRPAQLSSLVSGDNVEVQWYERVARHTGFRNALEMFTSGGDEATRRLLRLWRALPDDAARKDVLRAIQRTIVAEGELDATSDEE